ncbi:hypothetical protein CL652_02090 [bacterium]|nr:hypothetical protein [bacterium]|tara:strand:+ start:7596 stop:7913 length:318 start_codon:yes stop_codon:yes gene_type:complete
MIHNKDGFNVEILHEIFLGFLPGREEQSEVERMTCAVCRHSLAGSKPCGRECRHNELFEPAVSELKGMISLVALTLDEKGLSLRGEREASPELQAQILLFFYEEH